MVAEMEERRYFVASCRRAARNIVKTRQRRSAIEAKFNSTVSSSKWLFIIQQSLSHYSEYARCERATKSNAEAALKHFFFFF
mmetsp:Transcript_12965/g.34940  ORF Transcript_12965/g.34940 Transcript_12965/m.34940 type:complete len:82 (-) Transcript_12965:1181-1426(-)